MKITFLGNFDLPYTTESHHAWTYEKLGHQVTRLREAKTSKETILQHALNSNLFVWTHTHGWLTEGAAEILSTLRKAGIPSVGYHLDLFKGIKREIDMQTDPYWNIEYFFTADGPLVPDLKSKGIKAYYLPAGIVENECYLGTPREEFKKDVIFVGSKYYHPEYPYRPRLIEWLEKTYGNRFARIAGDTPYGTVRGKDLNDLYASAKVVVGDTLCMNFNYPDYFSDRLFETAGRGGFVVFPYISGVHKLFKFFSQTNFNPPNDDDFKRMNGGDYELITYDFGYFDQLKATIDYFLEHEEERNKIRLAGFERTKKDHTYTVRLKQMLDIIHNDKN